MAKHHALTTHVQRVPGQYTTPAAGTNPATIIAADYGDMMLCRNGSLPYRLCGKRHMAIRSFHSRCFAVNLNASKGAIGSILWMKTYDPPAGNLTIESGRSRLHKHAPSLPSYHETMQWVGFNLDNGNSSMGSNCNRSTLRLL